MSSPVPDLDTLDHELNTAIQQADISQSFEVYLEILDRFYSGDVEFFLDESQRQIVGKESARAFLLSFLVPVHIMAEVGGLSVSVQHTSIATDTSDTTATQWNLRFVAATGKQCVIRWVSLRAWRDSRVVYERVRDAYVEGGPLGWDDLDLLQSGSSA